MPPPPILVKKSAPAPPPPPPPKKVPSPSPLPPPPTVKKAAALSSSALRPPPAPGGSSGSGQVKLKPLHWDKVNPKPTSLKQIFILDPRKSQNSAIVITSLGMTRKKLVEALIKGQDFAAETLESPTKEEQSAILGFDGDVAKLAEAESFLFHLLKAVPTAFARVNPFLFKANYYPEIAHHSKSHGLFVKLLEAILKARNRMNAGTARGNAHACNLTALLKLSVSDVKSVDGKTTLLNFVVEEVPQAMTKEEQEKELLKLVVGGLSCEFSNVKKAASVDHATVDATCSGLECEGGRFVEKMMTFLESAEEEVKMAREEERRVMELVKRTTEYYQAGGSVKGKSPLHLFVCLDVMRSLQRRNIASSGSPSRQRIDFKFPVLPPNFMSDRSWSDSGESDSDM
ncbi:hypothetical protein Bca4012_100834 [Brassica carinata]